MSASPKRRLWPWLLIAFGAIVVLVFLASLIWRILNPVVEPFVEADGERTTIQVNITNASGVNGAGRKTLEFLRERGFDVVELSTLAEALDTSIVVDRMGDRASALKVATVLGIADSLVYSDMDSMMFVRASVILGKDLQRLTVFED